MRSALLATYLTLLSQTVGCPCAAKAETTAPEYLIKGAYLYNFAKFIDWPPEAFTSPNSPLVLCILAPVPFEHEIQNELQEKTVQNRKLLVKHVDYRHLATDCHILFIPGDNEERLRSIIAALKGKSVLLVGEASNFIQAGGMIRFVVEGGTVRFEVDQNSAERSGLKISSKLLRVAKKG
jgi:hypothetical protein